MMANEDYEDVLFSDYDDFTSEYKKNITDIDITHVGNCESINRGDLNFVLKASNKSFFKIIIIIKFYIH